MCSKCWCQWLPWFKAIIFSSQMSSAHFFSLRIKFRINRKVSFWSEYFNRVKLTTKNGKFFKIWSVIANVILKNNKVLKTRPCNFESSYCRVGVTQWRSEKVGVQLQPASTVPELEWLHFEAFLTLWGCRGSITWKP